ncbi:unnamed protein product [Ixodes persulcatus]
MDRVHEADRRSWIGEKMKVRDFKQQWAGTFGSCESDPEENGLRYKIMELMNVPESVVKALEGECGPHSLSSTRVLDLQDIPDNVDLVTVKLQKQDLDKRASDAAYRSRSLRLFKMMGSTSRVVSFYLFILFQNTISPSGTKMEMAYTLSKNIQKTTTEATHT